MAFGPFLALVLVVGAEGRKYVAHDPRGGVLHPLVEQFWPEHQKALTEDEGRVPEFVERSVAAYLKCGIAEHGIIRLVCPDCKETRAVSFSCKRRGFCPSCGARRMHDLTEHLLTRVLPDVPIRQYVLSPPGEVVGLLAARGDAMSALNRMFVAGIFRSIRSRGPQGKRLHCGAITFVQRFNKALSIFPHLHVLVLDGGYVEDDTGEVDFVRDIPPSAEGLRVLEERLRSRFVRWLSHHGYLDDESASPDGADSWWLRAVRAPSGLIAAVPRERSGRFDIHARVCVGKGDERGREQLCRYVTRPPLAEGQLEVLDEERVRLTFRAPMRGGQKDLVMHPLVLMRRLAWLIPPPTQHQVRYAGVLAPAARLRSEVVPAPLVILQGVWFQQRPFEPSVPIVRRVAWAKLLAQVYGVDGYACPKCSGCLRPVNAVLPPHAKAWLEQGRIETIDSTGPPTRKQLALALHC